MITFPSFFFQKNQINFSKNLFQALLSNPSPILLHIPFSLFFFFQKESQIKFNSAERVP